MKIQLIAIGKNMPAWINDGYDEYIKRLPSEFKISLTEIAAVKRTKSISLDQIQQTEGQKMLAAIPSGSLVIALDEHGQQWNTPELAINLQKWQNNWQKISLLIGGPEGLPPICLQKAQCQWSLSKLTFPHPLVRIIVAEQLYRAWSILAKHPYHRG
jgi:23S rRNA (pseudouridine1915-N3)-methyltransferase